MQIKSICGTGFSAQKAGNQKLNRANKSVSSFSCTNNRASLNFGPSFTGDFFISKDRFERIPDSEKESKLGGLGINVFDMKGKFVDNERIMKLIYSPDYDLMNKRVDFVENFPGTYDEIYDRDYDMYGCRKDYHRTSNRVEKLKMCFCDDDPEEEAKRQEFALYLKDRGLGIDEIADNINYAICTESSKLDDTTVSLIKIGIETDGKPINLSAGLTRHLEDKGIPLESFVQILKQKSNEEELSEEQLDIVADMRLYAKAYDTSDASMLKRFDDLNPDKRIKEEQWVNYSDGTTSSLLKSKYSSYYRVTNGTNVQYLTKETDKRYIRAYGHLVSSSSYLWSRFQQDLYENNGRYFDSYYMEFPSGKWKQTKAFKTDPSSERVYAKETVVSEYDGHKVEISLPSSGTLYFEKDEQKEK